MKRARIKKKGMMSCCFEKEVCSDSPGADGGIRQQALLGENHVTLRLGQAFDLTNYNFSLSLFFFLKAMTF